MFEHLDAFEEFLVIEKNLSKNTIQSYISDLLQFKEFNDDAEKYLAHLHNKQLHPNSIKRKFSAIKQFFKFIELPFNIKLPKTQQNLKIVDHKQLLQMIEECEKIRDKAFLHLLLATGCRVSEALHITNRQMQQCIKNQESHFVIAGKGNKERVVFITLNSLNLLHQYQKQEKTKKYLFESKTGKPLTRQWAHKIIQQLAKKMNLEETIHPHSFRHAQAMILLDAQVDLVTIQKILGHAHLQTTQIYLEMHFQQLQTAIKEHPLNMKQISTKQKH